MCKDWDDMYYYFLKSNSDKWVFSYKTYDGLSNVPREKEIKYCPWCGSKLNEKGCTKEV